MKQTTRKSKLSNTPKIAVKMRGDLYNPQDFTAESLAACVARFAAKYGATPTHARLNPINRTDVPNIQTQTTNAVLRGMLWLGVEDCTTK